MDMGAPETSKNVYDVFTMNVKIKQARSIAEIKKKKSLDLLDISVDLQEINRRD